MAVVLGVFSACTDSSGVNNPSVINHDPPSDPGEIYFEDIEEEHIQKTEDGIEYADNIILVTLKGDYDKKTAEELAQKYSGELVGFIELTGDCQIKLNGAKTYEELENVVSQISSEKNVDTASIDIQTAIDVDAEAADDGNAAEAFPNDEKWKNEWDKNGGIGGINWGVEAVRAPAVWKYKSKMTPVNVGLIDNSFLTTHEDLDFEEAYYNSDNVQYKENDNDSHGTHVAGTMAAVYDNNKGISGVYPFGKDHLYGVSCRGTRDNGSIFFWKCALANLITKNVKVINVSWGFKDALNYCIAENIDNCRDRFQKEADNLGAFLKKLLDSGYDFVIVQAAGNAQDDFFVKDNGDESFYGWSLSSSGTEAPSNILADYGWYISMINEKSVKNRIIVVGAAEYTGSSNVKERYKRAEFSNTGSRVDIMAPGVDIYSTVRGKSDSSSYAGAPKWEGTSMAAPHVSGAAACLWSFNNNLTGADVKEALMKSAENENCVVQDSSRGMVNVLFACSNYINKNKEQPTSKGTDGVFLGIVKDSDGHVLADVNVNAVNADSSVSKDSTSNSDGSIDMSLPAGTYTLTLTKDGYGKAVYRNIEIKSNSTTEKTDLRMSVPVTDFTISDSILTIGELNAIEPETVPADVDGISFTWTSSDPSVCSVSPEGDAGIITGNAKGTATITAKLDTGSNVIEKSCTVRVASKGRDTVLVLDVSGSMSGEPLEEMKKSAVKFCDDLLTDEYNNRVALVWYDDEIGFIDFTNDLDELKNNIENIRSGGTTNMYGGLEKAIDLLGNSGRSDNVKNIVLMADGLPNEGEISMSGSYSPPQFASYYYDNQYTSAVVDLFNTAKGDYNFYSLGFFHSLYGETYDYASTFMKMLTNKEDGYYEVTDADNLQFVFGDIAETVSSGAKTVINIACPVDAVVSYNGEQLSSVAAAASGMSKASFGTVQLLGKNKDIKVFSLDPGKDYDVNLTGTGEGTMDYLVNYFDENDNLTDYRSFTSVPVASTTVMRSTTATTTVTTLEIDFDGDGVFESNLQVGKNSEPVNPNPVPATTAPVVQEPDEPEIPENNGSQMEGWTIVLIVLAIVFIVGGIVTVIVLTTNSSMKKAREPKAVVPPVGFYKNENKEISLDSASSSGEISADTNVQSAYSEPPETEALNSSSGHICISWDYSDTGCTGEKSFTIPDGKNLIIGKYPSVTDAELPKECRNVSRIHCTISYNAQRNEYYVVDSSTNGTYFASKSYGNYNMGQRLQKGKRTCVKAGSYIALANTKCVVHLM